MSQYASFILMEAAQLSRGSNFMMSPVADLVGVPLGNAEESRGEPYVPGCGDDIGNRQVLDKALNGWGVFRE